MAASLAGCGHLVVTHPLDLAQHDHGSIILAQPGQLAPHELSQLVRMAQPLGSRRGAGLIAIDERHARIGPRPPPPDAVDARVVGRPDEPGAGVRGLDPLAVTPQADQRLLRHVLRLGGIAEHRAGMAVEPVLGLGGHPLVLLCQHRPVRKTPAAQECCIRELSI
jgi:hypothetical protein